MFISITLCIAEPPSVSDIMKPDPVYAKVPIKLSCVIRGVRPKRARVQWYKTPSCNGAGYEETSGGATESDSLTRMENLQDLTHLQSEGTVHTATVSLKLTVDDDHRVFCCVVHCGNKKFIRKTTVNVKGMCFDFYNQIYAFKLIVNLMRHHSMLPII